MFYINGEARTVKEGRDGCYVIQERSGKRYKRRTMEANEHVTLVKFQYFRHASNPSYSKRISTLRRVQPKEENSCFIVEYINSDKSRPLTLPPHGNRKGVEPFLPTDKFALQQAKELVNAGVRTRKVYQSLPQLRNKKQVYSLKKKNPLMYPNDPWKDIIELQMTPGESGNKFVRSVHLEERQISSVVYNENQSSSLHLAGHSNPIHIDTTYGDSAYYTYMAYEDTRLVNIHTNKHPMIIGPGLLHSKEKDTTAIGLFLSHVQQNHKVQPYFVTDECPVLERRIHEIWPNAVHGLGREHLITNFRRMCRKNSIPTEVQDEIKEEIFGPSRYHDLIPLMDTCSEEEFGRVIAKIFAKWQSVNSAKKVIEWLKVRYYTV